MHSKNSEVPREALSSAKFRAAELGPIDGRAAVCAERTGDRLYADMFVVHRIHTVFLDKLCRRYPVRSSRDWLVPTYPVGTGDRLLPTFA